MTTATVNGTSNARTARKSLADQIDRLDTILDGLADAVNESIADAVKDVITQVVSEAVETAVKEVLSSPELLHAALEMHEPPMAVPMPPPQPKKPTLKEKLATVGNALCEKAKQAMGVAKKTLSEACKTACQAGKQIAKIAEKLPAMVQGIGKALWAFRKPAAVAVGAGVVCGVACYMGGRMFASVANGLSGAAITLSAMTLPLKRLFWGGSA